MRKSNRRGENSSEPVHGVDYSQKEKQQTTIATTSDQDIIGRRIGETSPSTWQHTDSNLSNCPHTRAQVPIHCPCCGGTGWSAASSSGGGLEGGGYAASSTTTM